MSCTTEEPICVYRTYWEWPCFIFCKVKCNLLMDQGSEQQIIVLFVLLRRVAFSGYDTGIPTVIS
jgi:hypothetical protein